MAARLFGSVIWRSRLLPCPVAVTQLLSRGAGSAPSTPRLQSSLQDKPRTLEDLPRVSLSELIYRIAFQGFRHRMHELQIYEKQLYGPIYRDGLKAVCVNNAKMLEEVMRNEDTFPTRADMSIWREYRDLRGVGYGPFTVDGQDWYDFRAVLNKRMLHPRDCVQYGDTLNDIVTDFVKRMCFLRECSPTGDLVTGLANEFHRFSLEAIASILFETRLGCLEKEIPTSTQDFINSITKMFANNYFVFALPKWTRSLLPYWEGYISGWDGIFDFAKNLIDKKMASIQQRLDNKQDVEGEYLTYLLLNPQMSIKDVYGNITELLLAGVETTSNTLAWTLHLLSTNPQSQERLYEEVSSRSPADRIPSAAEVTQMPYLRAVFKEALRMFPVVPINGRIVVDKKITIGGYQLPKNTTFVFAHYAISHDEETFPEPFTFKPERWLRDGHDRPNAFGSIPFGFGVRGCVGRRIAELEMYLVLSRLIRQFEFKADPSMGELKCICSTTLVPDKPLSLHFVDRRRENAV